MTLTAALVAFINSVLALVANFGVSLSDAQKGSITLAVNAGAVFGALLFDHVTHRTLKPPPAGSATNGPQTP